MYCFRVCIFFNFNYEGVYWSNPQQQTVTLIVDRHSAWKLPVNCQTLALTNQVDHIASISGKTVWK